MENPNRRSLSTGTKIFILVAFIGLFYFVYKFMNNSRIDTIKEPTIAAFYLDGSVLHFTCLDSPKCFSDVDLGVQIKEANDPLKHPLSIASAYHENSKNLYLFLSGGVLNYLAKINLETGRAQILDLDTLSERDGPPNFFPGMGRLFHNKIVVFADGKAGILQDDFSLKTIELKDPVRDFIEAGDTQALFVSQLQSEGQPGKVFLIDLNSGAAEEKTFGNPQGAGQLVTVDGDLRHVYWISADYKTLHLYDVQTRKDIRSAPISASDLNAYTTLTGARYQYHGIWYYSRRCPCEGNVPALMMDMATLRPVVNPQDLLKMDQAPIGTFMIAPFGDNFLIGMTSRVLVISRYGAVIETYDLPKEWIGRNYLLLEYRK